MEPNEVRVDSCEALDVEALNYNLLVLSDHQCHRGGGCEQGDSHG